MFLGFNLGNGVVVVVMMVVRLVLVLVLGVVLRPVRCISSAIVVVLVLVSGTSIGGRKDVRKGRNFRARTGIAVANTILGRRTSNSDSRCTDKELLFVALRVYIHSADTNAAAPPTTTGMLRDMELQLLWKRKHLSTCVKRTHITRSGGVGNSRGCRSRCCLCSCSCSYPCCSCCCCCREVRDPDLLRARIMRKPIMRRRGRGRLVMMMLMLATQEVGVMVVGMVVVGMPLLKTVQTVAARSCEWTFEMMMMARCHVETASRRVDLQTMPHALVIVVTVVVVVGIAAAAATTPTTTAFGLLPALLVRRSTFQKGEHVEK